MNPREQRSELDAALDQRFDKIVSLLDKQIVFWRNVDQDPYHIGNSVLVCLEEIKAALKGGAK